MPMPPCSHRRRQRRRTYRGSFAQTRMSIRQWADAIHHANGRVPPRGACRWAARPDLLLRKRGASRHGPAPSLWRPARPPNWSSQEPEIACMLDFQRLCPADIALPPPPHPRPSLPRIHALSRFIAFGTNAGNLFWGQWSPDPAYAGRSTSGLPLTLKRPGAKLNTACRVVRPPPHARAPVPPLPVRIRGRESRTPRRPAAASMPSLQPSPLEGLGGRPPAEGTGRPGRPMGCSQRKQSADPLGHRRMKLPSRTVPPLQTPAPGPSSSPASTQDRW